jgi:hypothetical protein
VASVAAPNTTGTQKGTVAGGSVRSSPDAVPKQSRSPSLSSSSSRVDKGKEREREQEKEVGRDCMLLEFRRFGRWDGWS